MIGRSFLNASQGIEGFKKSLVVYRNGKIFVLIQKIPYNLQNTTNYFCSSKQNIAPKFLIRTKMFAKLLQVTISLCKLTEHLQKDGARNSQKQPGNAIFVQHIILLYEAGGLNLSK